MKSETNYYVYVYIDPRNLQEFYYGKGTGSRKLAHLDDISDSQKVRTIKEIKSEGLEPIIRVVAKGLTEEQALLVEKTLIWKLGRNLTNISTGHYSDFFRPHNTLHRDLYGFDFENALYYVNVGEGDHRNWDDCLKFGFLAAGQNWEKWGRKLYTLKEGDIVAAYLKNFGFVGVGRITQGACAALDFRYKGKPLPVKSLVQPRLLEVEKEIKDEEHLIAVEWIKAVKRDDAKWKKGESLFTTPLVIASLENQPDTVTFLEKEFGVSFESLLSLKMKAA